MDGTRTAGARGKAVSEVSQGPGWWLATDGKWYPPERHPNYVPPAPPPVDTAPTAPPSSHSAAHHADELAAYRGLDVGWYRDPANPTLARYWDGSRLSEERRPVASPVPPSTATPSRGHGSPRHLRRPSPTRPIYMQPLLWFAAAVVVLIITIAFALSGSSNRSGASDASTNTGTSGDPTTTVMPTTTTTTAPAPTTTTVAIPVAPQPTADDAASALVSGWATGNKPKALSVATAPAVATLFAAPYKSGLAVDRGCSDGTPPVTCTFGPPGGASPNDAIYSLTVAQTTAGKWYVSSVQILG